MLDNRYNDSELATFLKNDKYSFEDFVEKCLRNCQVIDENILYW